MSVNRANSDEKQRSGESDEEYFNRLFPKKPRGHLHIYEPVKTNWPDASEHLRPLLDIFEEISGLIFKADRGMQKKDAHDWYEEFGGDPQLVRDAYQMHIADGLYVRSLASIRTAARTIRAKKNAQSNIKSISLRSKLYGER